MEHATEQSGDDIEIAVPVLGDPLGEILRTAAATISAQPSGTGHSFRTSCTRHY